jgi:transposase
VEHYAGLDVSLELTSVCMVDAQGAVVCETKVPTNPDDLVRYLRSVEHPIVRIGLEAGPFVAVAARGAEQRRLRRSAA